MIRQTNVSNSGKKIQDVMRGREWKKRRGEYSSCLEVRFFYNDYAAVRCTSTTGTTILVPYFLHVFFRGRDHDTGGTDHD